MHDRWKDEFEDAIESMSDSEKAELIDRITASMSSHKNLLPPEQVVERILRIAALPMESPDDGFSGRDHDSLLYGSPSGPHQSQ